MMARANCAVVIFDSKFSLKDHDHETVLCHCFVGCRSRHRFDGSVRSGDARSEGLVELPVRGLRLPGLRRRALQLHDVRMHGLRLREVDGD